MQFEVLVSRQTMFRNFISSIRFQAVGRKIDVTDAVVPDEQIDDLRQFLSKRRLSTAEPEIGERRRVLRQPDNLVPRKIALLVQLVPIETGFARRVAVRGDEENDRVQLSLAAESPNTRVSFGETSL